MDGSGNILVIDDNLRRLYKFDSNGNFITTLVQDLGYTGMRDISLDGSGNIYLIDSGVLGNQVRKFDSSGNFITKWGTKGSGDGEFWSPAGIAIDGSGYVYVSDYNNNRYRSSLWGNKVWSGGRDSNSRHSAWKADALPAELPPLNSILL